MSLTGGLFFVVFSLPFVAIGLYLLVVSAGSFYAAGQTLRAMVHSSISDPVPPGELPDSGHAVVTGTVEAGGDGLPTSPLSGTDAVAYRFGLDQQSEGVGWWRVLDRGYAAPFLVSGSLGRVLVDPGEHEPRLEFDAETAVGPTEELSESTRETMADSEVVDEADSPQVFATSVDEPRRYEEGTIEPGETVYVYGAVEDDDSYGKRIDGDGSVGFAIHRDSPEGITEHDTTEAQAMLGPLLIGVFTLFVGGMFTIAGAFTFYVGLQVVIGS